MNTTVRNIFGVAAAVIVLLGVNLATEDSLTTEPNVNDNTVQTEEKTEVTTAENRSVASLKDFNDAIVDIAEKTNPSVVTITTKRTQEIRMVNPFSQFFGMPREASLRGGAEKLVSLDEIPVRIKRILEEMQDERN